MSKPRPTPIVCASCGMSNASTAVRCARCNLELNAKTHHGESDVFLRSWIGDYFVSHIIGEGALGKVYQASHRSSKHVVAIKILTAGASKEREHVERFVKEAQIMSQIRHPNLVEIYESGILTGNRPYLMMEYLQGSTLAQQIRERQRFASVEAASLFIPLCQALDIAHQKGIVHRDLKPDNIFLALQNNRLTVKILDFGVAKLVEPGRRTTHSGMLIGTPRYMSPEQAESPRDVDGRSDIYAIGAILYELVTGRAPFDATSTVALLFKHHDEPPPPPSTLVPSVSARMNALILRCLAKTPEQRPARALFVAQELQQILVDEARFASEEEQAFVRETNPGIELNFDNTGEFASYELEESAERSTTEPIKLSNTEQAEIQKMSRQLGIATATPEPPKPPAPNNNTLRVSSPKPPPPTQSTTFGNSKAGIVSNKAQSPQLPVAPNKFITPTKQPLPVVNKPSAVQNKEALPSSDSAADPATSINITLQEVQAVEESSPEILPPLPRVHRATAQENADASPIEPVKQPPIQPRVPEPPALPVQPPPLSQASAPTQTTKPQPLPQLVEANIVETLPQQPLQATLRQEEEEEPETGIWDDNGANTHEPNEEEFAPSPSMVKLLDRSTRSKLWFNEVREKLRTTGLVWLLFVICLATIGFGMWWVLSKEEKSPKVFAAVKSPEPEPVVTTAPPPPPPQDLVSLRLRTDPSDAKLILWVNQIPKEPEYREGALQIPKNAEIEIAILARGYQPKQIKLFMKEPRDITINLVKSR